MNKISPPDSIIFVNLRDKRLVTNGCYVISDETGRATYKRWRPNDNPPFQPASYLDIPPPELEGAIEEGVRLLDEALARRAPGPYQMQAAIAALHCTAATAAETDWPQISALYQALLRFTPTPIVELNAAVALGLATNLEQALDWIGRIEARSDLARYHLLPAAKADVLRRLGRFREAAASYRDALTLVTNPAERKYLERRLAACE